MILETHKKYYIEHLKEVGAKPELAEAIVELHIESGEQLATKHDLKDTKNELRAEIQQVKNELRGEIQKEIAPIHEKLAVLDERTKTSLNISLVILGAVLAPLVISLFPTLSKLL